jgi:hypothetical protein
MPGVMIRNLGTRPYHGVDPEPTTGAAFVSVDPGHTIEVSQAKADQLLGDFPGCWEVVRFGEGGAVETKPPVKKTTRSPRWKIVEDGSPVVKRGPGRPLKGGK